MKSPDKKQSQNKAIQEQVNTALAALVGKKGLERLAGRLKWCGAAHHREVFLGEKCLEDGNRKAVRAGVGRCDGANFCPRCHIAAASERVDRTLAICAAHLGVESKPIVNQKLIEDGLATHDLVPVVMLFTVTVPRKGGNPEEWIKDIERFEAVRGKFFDVANPKYYWAKIKNRFRILSFIRATDVTYQLFGEMSGPHWHAHGLFFALMEREKWEKLCEDSKLKEAFEDDVSATFYEEWQRAASNVDPDVKVRKPFRQKGKLKGGVTVELAKDLNAASQYIAKNMAFEMAFSSGKTTNEEDKFTWPELIEMQTLRNLDGNHIFSQKVRDEAKELYVFHASQASRDQFTIGNIKGRVTIETYYCGDKDEREECEKVECLKEENKTLYTHSAGKNDYNAIPRLEIEASVDAYEDGSDSEKIEKIWDKEERTQDEIRARIKDNADYVQEKAAVARARKGCESKKTLERAMDWCVRNVDVFSYSYFKRHYEKLYGVIVDP